MQNRIFQEDCISGMAAHLADRSVDLVITVPPFGVEFAAKRGNYNRKGSRLLEGYNEVKGGDYLASTRAWLSQVRRVLKPTGSLYSFSGWNYLKDILIVPDELDFTLLVPFIAQASCTPKVRCGNGRQPSRRSPLKKGALGMPMSPDGLGGLATTWE